MKITDVEAIVLRQAVVDDGIADGSQDDLVVRIHTDEGITGIGEVDSSPELVAGARPGAELARRRERASASVLIGEDPLDVERLWHKMYRGLIYFGRRGIAVHAISGLDIALWDIKGKALGKPVFELLGTPHRDRVRAYASRLMPDTTAEVSRGRDRSSGSRASPPSSSAGGRSGRIRSTTSRSPPPRRRRPATDVEIMIDSGLGYVADAKTAIDVARELEQLGIYWMEEPFEPDEYEAYAELADAVDLRITAGEQDATWWGFRELIDRAHVDLVQPDVTRCGGITETLRIAELAYSQGVATVPHAWKSGIIKAASLHCNAVMPDGIWQEYCVADTPIAKTTDRAASADRRRRLRRRADRARTRRRPRRGRARKPQNRPVTASATNQTEERPMSSTAADTHGPPRGEGRRRHPRRRQQRPAAGRGARGPRRHRDERLDLHRREPVASSPTTTRPSGRRCSATTTPTSTRPSPPSAARST